MTGETENKRKPQILVVGSGGSVGIAMEAARLIAEKNYDVQIISPRSAKLMGMKPHDEIIELPHIIPKTLQYYPHAEVEPNRRTRRKQARKNKRKR